MSEIVDKILIKYPHTTLNITESQLRVILEGLIETKDIEGEVLELGCHAGLTSVYIRRVLDEIKSKKEFHAYDSFQGLPEKKPQDECDKENPFIEGYFDLKGTWQIKTRFENNNLKLPILHEGWFSGASYPDKVSLCFLDGDFYDSILDGLKMVYPRLSIGGLLLIHDYKWELLPGVEKACSDYFGDISFIKVPSFGIGVIKK